MNLMTKRAIHCLMTCLLLWYGSTAGASALWHQIATRPATPAPGQSFLIEVKGVWPNGCPFSVSPVSIVGQEIRLRLTEQPGICVDALRPYTLSIDPAPTLPTGLAEGNYRIWVDAEDRAGTRPIAFATLAIRRPELDLTPETGFWVADPSGTYADSGSGVGFNLERQDSALAMIAYFYDASGEPRWYFSAGDAERAGYRGDLLEIRGGQVLFQPYQAPRDMQPSGRIDLSFTDRGHAEAWFSQAVDAGILAEIKVMPLSLVRFGFKAGATSNSLAGRWVLLRLDDEDGNGRLIQLSADPSSAARQLRMLDPQTQTTLDCGLILANADQPPRLCALQSGNTRVLLENNGINEMRSADGMTRLLRVDP